MLLWLANYLSTFEPGFAVFQYLTLRSILGVLTALITALFVGPWVIRSLETRQVGQSVRRDGPETHFSKRRDSHNGRSVNSRLYHCLNASMG